MTDSRAEILSGDFRTPAQAVECSPGEPVIFTDRRRVNQPGGVAFSATQVDDSRPELSNANDLFRVSVLGRARRHDANLGRRDHHPVRLQGT